MFVSLVIMCGEEPWGIELFQGTKSTHIPAAKQGIRMVGVGACDIDDRDCIYKPDVVLDIYALALRELLVGDICAMSTIADVCLQHIRKTNGSCFTLASLSFIWISWPCDTYGRIPCNMGTLRSWGTSPICDPQPLLGASGWQARCADVVSVVLMCGLKRVCDTVAAARATCRNGGAATI